MLPDVDPDLMQATLATELKFTPNYYRIHSPQEIEEAEQVTLSAVQEEESKSGVKRRLTQKAVSFPASPEEIDRDMLTPPNPATTEDSDQEQKASQAYESK